MSHALAWYTKSLRIELTRRRRMDVVHSETDLGSVAKDLGNISLDPHCMARLLLNLRAWSRWSSRRLRE